MSKKSGAMRNYMDCNYETEYLKINMIIAEDTKQTIVKGKVSVPDPKPDVEQILSVEKSARVRRIEVLPDKVVVHGSLNLQIVYVARKPDQSVHSMHHMLTFTTFIDLPGVEPDMDVDVKLEVEDVNVKQRHDCNCDRDFDVVAVIKVDAKATQPEELNVVVKVHDNNAIIESERLKVDHLIGNARKQIMVDEVFRIPDPKPDIEQIINVDAEVTITHKKIIRNKVMFDGEVHLQVLYVARKPDQPVHELHKVIKFSDFVEVPGAGKHMKVEIKTTVESVNVDPVKGNPRRLDAGIVLEVKVNVTDPRTVYVVTDVKDSNCKATKYNLRVDQLVGEASTQVVVESTSAPPDPKPCAEKILECRVEHIDIEKVEVLSDKVVIRGTLEVKVIYVAMKPNQSVHAMHKKMSFRTFVEVPGARKDMDVSVMPMVEFVKAETRGPKVYCEAVIKILVRVTESMDQSVVIALDMSEEPEEEPESPVCKPGDMISYTIKSGDTFYKLAMQYDIPLQDLLDANPNVNPNNLRVGQVINIPCVAKG
ncbi:Peptidoglycan-binding LysM [Desulfofarcimen acetoxidans DSM 771]|uniref:Peptidoglycan-binding LysM n=1 Tax=Desulfofarcimen acetoxidans (strain ATCC 49208 / DSM 771 / KCTC 5769 / VKM B-1644 / 5575) TaxID=485916 RepID=C8W2Z0_DESAS|nr:SPOCS domain-containing protein [Desulfofarcimen acetoxidans]ACV61146.1 Peptidoglycan-binding LysM [Desulfofarcimen acetoxidans DSM 771]